MSTEGTQNTEVTQPTGIPGVGDGGATAPQEKIPVGAPDASAPQASDELASLRSQVKSLEKQLQSSKVDEGRVRTLSSKLSSAESRIAELTAIVENGGSRGSGSGAYPSLDPEVSRALKDTVDSSLSPLSAELEAQRAEVARLQEERKAEQQRAQQAQLYSFLAQVRDSHPGFLEAINAGGEYAKGWMTFLNAIDEATGMPYGKTASDAQNMGNIHVFSRVINDFCEESGLKLTTAQVDIAPPRGRVSESTQGGRQAEKRIWKQSEHDAEFDRIRKEYEAGRMKFSELQAAQKKLADAIMEGRVTQG